MPNYTQEEVDAAVKKYIRTDIRTTRDPLGPRDTDKVFSEVMEFISSSLIFDANSIFYLIWLAKNRVNQDLNSALTALADIEQAIEEIGRYTKKVTSTSLLSDAAAALLEADRLLTQKSVIAAPQFNRYTEALDQFTDVALAPNIRNLVGAYPVTYEIVRPPQGAQSAIKADIPSLRSLHTTVLSETSQLGVALTEFLGLNLPVKAAQNSVKKVQTDLKTLKTEFDNSTEAEAIEKTRDAYLRITAGRSVIENLTNMPDPSADRMRGSATTSDRAQAASPASTVTPGQVTTTSAPFHIVPGTKDTLSFKIDLSTLLDVTFAPASPAKVQGSNSDQSLFQIYGDSAAAVDSSFAGPYTVANTTFDIYVDGRGYSATLTAGSRTAGEVAGEVAVAARIDGAPGVFSDVATGFSVSGVLRFQRNTTGPGSITIGSQAVNSELGFTDGQTGSGTSANNILRLWVDDELEVLAALTTGARTAAQVAADITAASSRVSSAPYTLGAAEGVAISSKAYGAQSRIQVISTAPVHQAAMSLLGLTGGQNSRSRYLSLGEAFDVLNATAGILVEQSASSLASGGSGVATIVGSSYILELPPGSIPLDFSIHDRLRIVTGENSGDYFVLSFVRDTPIPPLPAPPPPPVTNTITVNRPFPVTSGIGAQNQQWELRRDLLTVKSPTTGLTSAVEALTSNALTEFGLSTGVNRGKTSGIRVRESGLDLSFSRHDVRVGDFLYLPLSTKPYLITEVSYGGYQVEVSLEVPNDLLGSLYYIVGSAAEAHAAFLTGLATWEAELADSVFESDILDLERKLNPLLFNTRPTQEVVNDAKNSATALRTLYEDLQSVFTAFYVGRVDRIDAVLDMLLERGMRRGHDLLLLGQLVNFFSINRDTSSYGGNMMEKMKKVAQNDVPVSRSMDGGQSESQLTASFTDVDYTSDFSDGDDERAIAETDDIPEPSADELVLTGV